MNLRFTLLFVLLYTLSFAQPGNLDTSFGNNGIVITELDENIDPFEMMLQTDGKILVAGRYKVSGSNFILIRYNSNGSIDTSFGEDGIFISEFKVFNQVDIAIQTDGKIVATGSLFNEANFFVIRLNSDGSFDSSFGSEGYIEHNFNGSSDAFDVVLTADNKILIGGRVFIDSKVNMMLMRLNSNGSVDTAFGNNGMVGAPSFQESDLYEIMLGSNERIFIGGTTGSFGAIAIFAYTVNGVPDVNYGENGVAKAESLGFSTDYYSFEIDENDRVYGIGVESIGMAAVRFNSDGTLDTSYGIDGVFMNDLDFVSIAYGSCFDNEGRIIATGRYFDDGNNSILTIRINEDGTLDETFGDNGLSVVNIDSDYQDRGKKVLIRPNGHILVGGESDQPFPIGRFVLLGLQSDIGTATIDSDKKIMKLNIFPNPTSSNISVEYQIEKSSKITSGLIDASGKLVQSFFSEMEHEQGSYKENFVIDSQLPEGEYFLFLKTKNNIETIPFFLSN